MAITTEIKVKRGHNIGKAIQANLPNYPKVNIIHILVTRDVINKVNIAIITYNMFYQQ